MPKIVNTKVKIIGESVIDVPVYFEDTDDGKLIEDVMYDLITSNNEILESLGSFNDEKEIDDYKVEEEYTKYLCDDCNKKINKEEWLNNHGLCNECYKKYFE